MGAARVVLHSYGKVSFSVLSNSLIVHFDCLAALTLRLQHAFMLWYLCLAAYYML